MSDKLIEFELKLNVSLQLCLFLIRAQEISYFLGKVKKKNKINVKRTNKLKKLN